MLRIMLAAMALAGLAAPPGATAQTEAAGTGAAETGAAETDGDDGTARAAFFIYEDATEADDEEAALRWAGIAWRRGRAADDISVREKAALAVNYALAMPGEEPQPLIDLYTECIGLLDSGGEEGRTDAANIIRAQCHNYRAKAISLTGDLVAARRDLVIAEELYDAQEDHPTAQKDLPDVYVGLMLLPLSEDPEKRFSEAATRELFVVTLRAEKHILRGFGPESMGAALIEFIQGQYQRMQGQPYVAIDMLTTAHDIFVQIEDEQFADLVAQNIKLLLLEMDGTPPPAGLVADDEAGRGCGRLMRDEEVITLCTMVSPQPPYPPLAESFEQHGYALLRYDVTADGTVETVRVERSWPENYFGRDAVQAVRDWRYHPPEGPDGPVQAEDIPIFFTFVPETGVGQQ